VSTSPAIWLTANDDAVGSGLGRASEGDYLLVPRGGVYGVGRVSGGEVVWLEQVRTDLLPDGDRVRDAEPGDGGVQRIEDAPVLLRALEGIEDADALRGG
jgi:hypothetical protein